MKNGRFLQVWHAVLHGPAWPTMPPDGRCILLDIWSRYHTKNGKPVAYSWTMGQRCLGDHGKLAHRRRVGAAFIAIEASGLATVIKKGRVGPSGERANLWQLSDALIGGGM